MTIRDTLADPIFKNNPIALQILGICSALAVTTSLKVTVVMCIALTLGTAVSSFFHLEHSPLHPLKYPHYRANDHHCVVGDRGRSGAQSSGLRHF